jgi:hypothetical protein
MKPQLTSLALLIAVTSAQNSPPPASIRISGVSYSGSGCPQGSVSSMIADSKDLVTFGFDKFQATIGPGSPQGSSRKNCNINLQLIFGDGYQMAVAETVYHGYTRLDDGVNAKFTTDYSYKSDPNPPKKVSRISRYKLTQHANGTRRATRSRPVMVRQVNIGAAIGRRRSSIIIINTEKNRVLYGLNVAKTRF